MNSVPDDRKENGEVGEMRQSKRQEKNVIRLTPRSGVSVEIIRMYYSLRNDSAVYRSTHVRASPLRGCLDASRIDTFIRRAATLDLLVDDRTDAERAYIAQIYK